MKTVWRRYFTVIEPKEKKKIDRIEIGIKGEDFSGDMWFTDIMVQEGSRISGYVPNTKEMHLRRRVRGTIAPTAYYNTIIRSKKTIIVPNLGEITSAVDFTLTALERLPADTVQFQHGWGTRTFEVKDPLSKNDVYEFHASKKLASINNVPTNNYTGVFHQIPSGDALFNVDVGKSKSGQLLIEFNEWDKGIGGKLL